MIQRPSLLFCPVGNPVPTLPNFDNGNHWRYGHPAYEVLVVAYNEYNPEIFSYDWIHYGKGMKWTLAKQILKTIDISKYEYIGFIDDDLLMTRSDVASCLNRAYHLNTKLFQLSVDKNSDCSYKLLYQNDNLEYSTTNFIEVMAPFIHTDVLPTVQKFWEFYDIDCGWGFDSVLCNLVGETATVFHDVCMIHPKKETSAYNKHDAFVEQAIAIQQAYPNFMQDEYGVVAPPVGNHQILNRKVRT